MAKTLRQGLLGERAVTTSSIQQRPDHGEIEAFGNIGVGGDASGELDLLLLELVDEDGQVWPPITTAPPLP